MLFLEEFAAGKRAVKLQIFASDIGADALDFARNGVYPDSINADVSAERLQRFFYTQDHGYRVSRDLRDVVLFTDHDLLADPPFSRLDLISCRNLLIRGTAEGLVAVPLRAERGRLSVSRRLGDNRPADRVFRADSSTLRIFRDIGHGQPRAGALPADVGERARALWPRMTGRPDRPIPNLAEIAQRALLDIYAPATVVVDRNYRALHFCGPTDRYLRVATGEPSRDVPAMLREGLASRFRTAIRQASRDHGPVTVGSARMKRNGDLVSVSISRGRCRTKVRSCCSSASPMRLSAGRSTRSRRQPKPRVSPRSSRSSMTRERSSRARSASSKIRTRN